MAIQTKGKNNKLLQDTLVIYLVTEQKTLQKVVHLPASFAVCLEVTSFINRIFNEILQTFLLLYVQNNFN